MSETLTPAERVDDIAGLFFGDPVADAIVLGAGFRAIAASPDIAGAGLRFIVADGDHLRAGFRLAYDDAVGVRDFFHFAAIGGDFDLFGFDLRHPHALANGYSPAAIVLATATKPAAPARA